MYFRETKGKQGRQRKRRLRSQSLLHRLCDYVVLCQRYRSLPSKSSLVSKLVSLAVDRDNSQSPLDSNSQWIQESRIIHHFPQQEHTDLFIPEKLDWFCFASEPIAATECDEQSHDKVLMDCRETSCHSIESRMRFHTVIHAPGGLRLYAYCMNFKDVNFSSSAEGQSSRTGFPLESELSICLISRIPSIDFFCKLLTDVASTYIDSLQDEYDPQHRRLKTVLDQLGDQLVWQVPMPVPGVLRIRFEISVTLGVTPGRQLMETVDHGKSSRLHDEATQSKFDIMNHFLEALNEKLLPKTSQPESHCFTYELGFGKYGDMAQATKTDGILHLFSYFDTLMVVKIWTAMLIETNVMFISSDLAQLTEISESFIRLLYPFRWHHIYIPVLPLQLFEVLEAPVPFILGIHRSNAKSLPSSAVLSEVLVVDIDAGCIVSGSSSTRHLKLPLSDHNRLVKMVQHQLGVRSCVIPAKETDIIFCFLECFCSLLHGYKSNLFFLGDEVVVFNEYQFLEARKEDSAFFKKLISTNAFEHLKETQNSKWLNLFHAFQLVHFEKCRRLLDIMTSLRYKMEQSARLVASPRPKIPEKVYGLVVGRKRWYRRPPREMNSVKVESKKIGDQKAVESLQKMISSLEPLRVDLKKKRRDCLRLLDLTSLDDNQSRILGRLDSSSVAHLCQINEKLLLRGIRDLSVMLGLRRFSTLSRTASICSRRGIALSDAVEESLKSTEWPVQHDAPLTSWNGKPRIGSSVSKQSELSYQSEAKAQPEASLEMPEDPILSAVHDVDNTIEIGADSPTELVGASPLSGKLHRSSSERSSTSSQVHLKEPEALNKNQMMPVGSNIVDEPEAAANGNRQQSLPSVGSLAPVNLDLDVDFETQKQDARLLQEVLSKVFLGQPVESQTLIVVSEHLLGSQSARGLFVELLNQSVQSGPLSSSFSSSSRSLANVLEKKSRLDSGVSGHGLKHDSFQTLVHLSRSCIESCCQKNDFTNARKLLNVSRSYFDAKVKPTSDLDFLKGRIRLDCHVGSLQRLQMQNYSVAEYLEQRLLNLNLWSSARFWQHCFSDLLSLSSSLQKEKTASRTRTRSRTCSTTCSSAEDDPHQSNRLVYFDDAQPDRLSEMKQLAQEDKFEVLAMLLNQMIRLKVQKLQAFYFLELISETHDIEKQNKEVLKTLVENLFNANFE